MERIVGPLRGHYLAAYTVESYDGHYAYAKVCAGKPESPWDGTPVVWKVAAGPCPTEESALQMALEKAERELIEASEWQVLWEAGKS